MEQSDSPAPPSTLHAILHRLQALPATTPRPPSSTHPPTLLQLLTKLTSQLVEILSPNRTLSHSSLQSFAQFLRHNLFSFNPFPQHEGTTTAPEDDHLALLHETIAALIEWIVKAELGSGEDGEEEKGNEEKRPWVNVLLMLSEGLQMHISNAEELDENDKIVKNSAYRTLMAPILMPTLAGLATPSHGYTEEHVKVVPELVQYNLIEAFVDLLSKHPINKELARQLFPPAKLADILFDAHDFHLSRLALEIAFRLAPGGSMEDKRGAKSIWVNGVFPGKKFGVLAQKLVEDFSATSAESFYEKISSLLSHISLHYLGRCQPFYANTLFFDDRQLIAEGANETEIWIARDSIGAIISVKEDEGTDDEDTYEKKFLLPLGSVLRVDIGRADTKTETFETVFYVSTAPLLDSVPILEEEEETVHTLRLKATTEGKNRSVMEKTLGMRGEDYPKLLPIPYSSDPARANPPPPVPGTPLRILNKSKPIPLPMIQVDPSPALAAIVAPPPPVKVDKPVSSPSRRKASQAAPITGYYREPTPPPPSQEEGDVGAPLRLSAVAENVDEDDALAAADLSFSKLSEASQRRMEEVGNLAKVDQLDEIEDEEEEEVVVMVESRVGAGEGGRKEKGKGKEKAVNQGSSYLSDVDEPAPVVKEPTPVVSEHEDSGDESRPLETFKGQKEVQDEEEEEEVIAVDRLFKLTDIDRSEVDQDDLERKTKGDEEEQVEVEVQESSTTRRRKKNDKPASNPGVVPPRRSLVEEDQAESAPVTTISRPRRRKAETTFEVQIPPPSRKSSASTSSKPTAAGNKRNKEKKEVVVAVSPPAPPTHSSSHEGDDDTIYGTNGRPQRSRRPPERLSESQAPAPPAAVVAATTTSKKRASPRSKVVGGAEGAKKKKSIDLPPMPKTNRRSAAAPSRVQAHPHTSSTLSPVPSSASEREVAVPPRPSTKKHPRQISPSPSRSRSISPPPHLAIAASKKKSTTTLRKKPSYQLRDISPHPKRRKASDPSPIDEEAHPETTLTQKKGRSSGERPGSTLEEVEKKVDPKRKYGKERKERKVLEKRPKRGGKGKGKGTSEIEEESEIEEKEENVRMSKEDQLRKKRAERPIVEEEPIETDKPVERRKKKSLQELMDQPAPIPDLVTHPAPSPPQLSHKTSSASIEDHHRSPTPLPIPSITDKAPPPIKAHTPSFSPLLDPAKDDTFVARAMGAEDVIEEVRLDGDVGGQKKEKEKEKKREEIQLGAHVLVPASEEASQSQFRDAVEDQGVVQEVVEQEEEGVVDPWGEGGDLGGMDWQAQDFDEGVGDDSGVFVDGGEVADDEAETEVKAMDGVEEQAPASRQPSRLPTPVPIIVVPAPDAQPIRIRSPTPRPALPPPVPEPIAQVVPLKPQLQPKPISSSRQKLRTSPRSIPQPLPEEEEEEDDAAPPPPPARRSESPVAPVVAAPAPAPVPVPVNVASPPKTTTTTTAKKAKSKVVPSIKKTKSSRASAPPLPPVSVRKSGGKDKKKERRKSAPPPLKKRKKVVEPVVVEDEDESEGSEMEEEDQAVVEFREQMMTLVEYTIEKQRFKREVFYSTLEDNKKRFDKSASKDARKITRTTDAVLGWGKQVRQKLNGQRYSLQEMLEEMDE